MADATAGIVLITTPIHQAQSSVLTVSEVILNLGDIEGLVGLAWRVVHSNGGSVWENPGCFSGRHSSYGGWIDSYARYLEMKVVNGFGQFPLVCLVLAFCESMRILHL